MSGFLLYFDPFFALFDPYFLYKTGSKYVYIPLVIPKKYHLFLTRIFMHPTSSKKVAFFAGRSVQGFQKPYYFIMKRHTQFLVGVATVSVGGDV